MSRLKLIPPEPSDSPYAPKDPRTVPVPQDLAEHRPILPYDDDSSFAEQLDRVDRAAAALFDPLRDVARAIEALSYREKADLAGALRTSITRLTAWASLVLEARP